MAWATYDANTGTWSEPQWLTQDPIANAQTPVLSQSGDGSVQAAWRSNPHGQLSGDNTNPDRIFTARWNDNGWDTPQVAVSEIPGLVDLALAHRGNQAVLAWTAQMTPTGSLTPTLQLFTSQFNGSVWGAPVQLTDSPDQHTRPQIIYRQGEAYVVWLAGEVLTLQRIEELVARTYTPVLRSATLISGTAVQLKSNQQVDQFRVLQDSGGNLFAVFTGQQGIQRDIFLAYYDATVGVWGVPQQITDDRASENYPAASIDSEDRLLMVYARTLVHDEERSATLDNGQIVTFTVPVDGQTDLYTLAHNLRSDLAVESIAISEEYPNSGDTITVTAVLANLGDVPLLNIDFVFQDNGVIFASHTLTGPMTAGQVITLTVPYTVPADGGPRTLVAMADPENSILESDESNNSSELVVFGPDLEVVGISVESWGGGEVDLVSQIANLGTTPSPTTTLTYHLETMIGSPIVSNTLPIIGPGEIITFTSPWNIGDLDKGQYNLIGIVNPQAAAFPELNIGNNAYTTTLQVGLDLMVSPYYLSATSLTAPTATVTTTVFNIGTAQATDVSITLYRRGNLQPDSLVLTHTVSSLDAGEFVVFTDTLSGPLGCGLYIQAMDGPESEDISTTNNLAHLPAENGRCAAFYNTPVAAIAPATVAFTDTSTGENTTWLWDFGDGNTSTDQNPVHVYASRGSYTVTLEVFGPDGSDRVKFVDALRVYQAAQANFDATPISGPAPLQVDFSDNSTGDINTWIWDFGDGGGSTMRNPIHIYDTPGTYSVTLTVAGLGGESVRVFPHSIEVYQAASANFHVNLANGIAPLEVSFTDTSSGDIDSWSWDFGDGSTSAVQNPTYTYTSRGNYTVTLTIEGLGGEDHKVLPNAVEVYQAALADFGAEPISGTVPLEVSFINNSTGDIDTWSWDFGDGSTSSEQNPVHIYLNSGSYTVTLTSEGLGGKDTINRVDYISVTEDKPQPLYLPSIQANWGKTPEIPNEGERSIYLPMTNR